MEARIDAAAHLVLARLPRGAVADGLVEFLVFGLKQAWACLFGGLMLGMIIVTRLWWPEIGLNRYDFWFVAALIIQAGMILFRLETLDEARVILIFHIVGTIMEVFKTSVGSWVYPDDALFRIAGVPLFSGFMYACVGSYMARIQRIFDITFSRYPPIWLTVLLALGIYVNFFSHHYFYDFRWWLFSGVVLLYGRSFMHYRVFRFRHSMPMLLAFLLVALFIWIAENIGTWSRAWIYPAQENGWSLVSFEKLGSWYLLMLISVVLVTLVHPPRPFSAAKYRAKGLKNQAVHSRSKVTLTGAPYARAQRGNIQVAQVDVFSLAAAITALLLAVALLIAYAINRRLRGFVWWAASFALLALWLATATLRFGKPVVPVLWLSWGSLYAAACLVAYGLYRAGATRISPLGRMVACGALFGATASVLTAMHARPYHWFLIAPLPTVVFMAWSAVLVFRARAWGYGATLAVGTVLLPLLSLVHPGGLARALSPDRPPPPALRGGFDGGVDPGGPISLDPRGAAQSVLDIAPPPGVHPPVEQPLTVTLITVVALLALAIALVLRDMLTELDRMRERSSIDPMTGLLNRATFQETAAALLRETSVRPVFLILFDIDHFKRINDTAGHAAGDQVISRLGRLLCDMAVSRGAAGRVGGEEFAVILAGGDLDAAQQFADAIRAGLSASDFGDEIGWGVTISAGIAKHLDGESLDSLTARADKALYAAKEGGRDTVVVAADIVVERGWPNPTIRLASSA